MRLASRRALSLVAVGLLVAGAACQRRPPRQPTATPPRAQFTETWTPPPVESPTSGVPSSTGPTAEVAPLPSPPTATPDLEADRIDQLLGDLEDAVGSSDDLSDLP